MSPTVTAHSVLRPVDDLSSVTVDGEMVVYEPVTNSFHRLDPIASTVWALLDGETTLEVTCHDLAEGFGADPNVVWGDVEPLVAKLLADGLVTHVPSVEVTR